MTWRKILQNYARFMCVVHRQPADPSLYPETGLWIGEGHPDAHQDMLCSTFERS